MIELLKSHKTFEGKTEFWKHNSKSTQTEMKFSTFIPEGEIKGCLVWLSGLTCNEENFITKVGVQNHLKDSGIMVIAPDTSPRGLDLPNEHESYDFGSGAGFYINAMTKGYKDHYQMYDYIIKDLCEIIKEKFKTSNLSIFGHSMGGHGALVLGLKNPNLFNSISAFSPIVNPCETDWGKKAFEGYLGVENKEIWKEFDATEIVKSGTDYKNHILIDQGTGDDFLNKELFPDVFKSACEMNSKKLDLNLRKDYDHSYYFISTFMKDHIDFHLKYLI